MKSTPGPADATRLMLPRKNNLLFGNTAEQFASELLVKKGYKILLTKFRSRFGEIDIIALDGDTLVFVEVKARTNRKFGLPEESVTSSKLWKIRKTAEYYSATHPQLPKRLRIDVVALELFKGKAISSRIITVE